MGAHSRLHHLLFSLPRDERAALARRCGTTLPALATLISSRRAFPASLAVALQGEFGGAIDLAETRPDVFLAAEIFFSELEGGPPSVARLEKAVTVFEPTMSGRADPTKDSACARVRLPTAGTPLHAFLSKGSRQDALDFARRCGTTLEVLRVRTCADRTLGVGTALAVVRESGGEVPLAALCPQADSALKAYARHVKADPRPGALRLNFYKLALFFKSSGRRVL